MKWERGDAFLVGRAVMPGWERRSSFGYLSPIPTDGGDNRKAQGGTSLGKSLKRQPLPRLPPSSFRNGMGYAHPELPPSLKPPSWLLEVLKARR